MKKLRTVTVTIKCKSSSIMIFGGSPVLSPGIEKIIN
jgi:hypothetical protein